MRAPNTLGTFLRSFTWGHVRQLDAVAARFSVTARMTATVTAAISAIPATSWTAIRYPHAIWDEAEQGWISDAEIAEVPFTAFTAAAAPNT